MVLWIAHDGEHSAAKEWGSTILAAVVPISNTVMAVCMIALIWSHYGARRGDYSSKDVAESDE